MRISAIICEYNPFHNGHAHMLRELRGCGSTVVVAVMSGAWVQRGEPAMIDKYARARMAIACGCDLVLELPAPWSMAGAEFFARAGVHIADCIGAHTLAFGSESGDLASLSLTSERLASPEFADALTSMRNAHPEWNAARLRERVYAELYGESKHFSGSNDLLALEYLRAIRTLGAKIEPLTIPRIGGEFGSTALGGICSATAIRRAVREGIRDFSPYMPTAAAEIFREVLDAGQIHELSRLDTAAASLLGTRDASEFAGIMEISGGMENRLCAAAREHDTIDGIIGMAKEQRYSESRLRRAIVSAMLGIRMADADVLPKFTNILAMSERGREVLAANRKNERLSLLAKPSAAGKLTGDTAEQYALNRRAERLYALTQMKNRA